jgi:hypothetical protein
MGWHVLNIPSVSDLEVTRAEYVKGLVAAGIDVSEDASDTEVGRAAFDAFGGEFEQGALSCEAQWNR